MPFILRARKAGDSHYTYIPRPDETIGEVEEESQHEKGFEDDLSQQCRWTDAAELGLAPFVHGSCVICEAALRSCRNQIVFLPCGHRCFHVRCYNRAVNSFNYKPIVGESCPICDRAISKVRMIEKLDKHRFMSLTNPLPDKLVLAVGSPENARIIDGRRKGQLPAAFEATVCFRDGSEVKLVLPPKYAWQYSDVRTILHNRGFPRREFHRFFVRGANVPDDENIVFSLVGERNPFVTIIADCAKSVRFGAGMSNRGSQSMSVLPTPILFTSQAQPAPKPKLLSSEKQKSIKTKQPGDGLRKYVDLSDLSRRERELLGIGPPRSGTATPPRRSSGRGK